MRKLFEEYGLFLMAVVIGMICISFFLMVFVGDNSVIGPLLDAFLERLM